MQCTKHHKLNQYNILRHVTVDIFSHTFRQIASRDNT